MVVISNMELVDIEVTIFFVPTKGYCFVKCINFLTEED